MNIKEYIESGVLELYLLGALSEEEQAEVCALVKEHKELEEELNRLEADLISLAEKNAPESLSEDILTGTLKQINEAKSTSKEDDSTPLIPIANAKNNKFIRYALIAASVLLVISLGVNFKIYNSYKQAEQALLSLQEQNSIFAKELEIQEAKYEVNQSQLLALSNPNTVRINLEGIPGKEGSLATVYWNKESKETYINIQNLPSPPEGMQYQLWALVDGVPVDAGVFEFNNKIQNQNKRIENVDAFAVTLEEAGGKASPNLEQLFVYGAV